MNHLGVYRKVVVHVFNIDMTHSSSDPWYGPSIDTLEPSYDNTQDKTEQPIYNCKDLVKKLLNFNQKKIKSLGHTNYILCMTDPPIGQNYVRLKKNDQPAIFLFFPPT